MLKTQLASVWFSFLYIYKWFSMVLFNYLGVSQMRPLYPPSPAPQEQQAGYVDGRLERHPPHHYARGGGGGGGRWHHHQGWRQPPPRRSGRTRSPSLAAAAGCLALVSPAVVARCGSRPSRSSCSLSLEWRRLAWSGKGAQANRRRRRVYRLLTLAAGQPSRDAWGVVPLPAGCVYTRSLAEGTHTQLTASTVVLMVLRIKSSLNTS